MSERRIPELRSADVIWEGGRCKECHEGELLFAQEEASGELLRLCRRCGALFHPDSSRLHTPAGGAWPRPIAALGCVPATRAVIESAAVIVGAFPSAHEWPDARLDALTDDAASALHPRRLADAHPVEPHFAVQRGPAPEPPGIVVLRTGAEAARLWELPDAIDFRWTRRGAEAVVLLRAPSASRPPDFFLERWTWPSRERIQRFGLPPGEAPAGLACSPDGRFVAVARRRSPPPRRVPAEPAADDPPPVAVLEVWSWGTDGSEEIATAELPRSSHVLRPRWHRGAFVASAGLDLWWDRRSPRHDTPVGALLVVHPLLDSAEAVPVLTRTQHGWHPLDTQELLTPGIPRRLPDGRLALALPGSGGKEAFFSVPG